MRLRTVLTVSLVGRSASRRAHMGPKTFRVPGTIVRTLCLLFCFCFAVPASTALAQQPGWNVIPPPSPRNNHAMVYDAGRGVTVLFGGYSNGVYYGDTWEWDGIVWTLRSISGPAPRYRHAMAYDSARGVTVLFGGLTGSGDSGECWEWD